MTLDYFFNRFSTKFFRCGTCIPYDKTRVRLRTDGGDNDDDYVNASWISQEGIEWSLIAAQTPMDAATAERFWRAVEENDIGTVVVLWEDKAKAEAGGRI